MNKFAQTFFILVLVSAATIAQKPIKTSDGKSLINLDENGCALRGFDPVAMFTMPDTTLKWDEKIQSSYRRAKYWFVSEEKKTFDANPAKYEPQFGGFCAFAITEGNLRPIQI